MPPRESMKPAELTREKQTAILAERYSDRAQAYDKYWSPVNRVDNVFGDRNLVCICPSPDDYR